jgi:hypothetical protein
MCGIIVVVVRAADDGLPSSGSFMNPSQHGLDGPEPGGISLPSPRRRCRRRAAARGAARALSRLAHVL